MYIRSGEANFDEIKASALCPVTDIKRRHAGTFAHAQTLNIEGNRSEGLTMSEAKTTTDHNKIRRWAEERGGVPTSVSGTGDGETGILRLDFDPKDEQLKEISWADFFDKFEEKKLAFLYQDRTDDGSVSRFHKFVGRSSAH
jgi:hypothetical protein